MDTKSFHIVQQLLGKSDSEIWGFAQKQTQIVGNQNGWSQNEIKDARGKNYNALMTIKYNATDAIKAILSPEQQVLQGLKENEIREFAISEAQKQSTGQNYTQSEVQKIENSIYKELLDEQTKVHNLLTGKEIHPNIDLALFDTTEAKNEYGLNSIRDKFTTLDINNTSISKSIKLKSQNFKEILKDPISSIWNSKERQERDNEVRSGKTLEEANLNMQEKRERKPLNILTNILSGNPEKQDRALNGIKGIFGNLLSGNGTGSKIIPAVAGFAGTHMAGFGNITSVVVAILAALIVPMIMRGINGNKSESINSSQGLSNNEDTNESLRKLAKSKEQSLNIQKEQTLHQAQEIERPAKSNQPVQQLNNQEMLAYIQQNGICALRTQMGADNSHFMEFIHNNNLESTLKAEEMGKFNGKTNPITAISQTITKTNSPIIDNTVKVGIGIG